MGSCGLIMLDEIRGMDLISWFPCVVTFGISFPCDQILKSFRASELSVCDDSFDFVFFFSVKQLRRGSPFLLGALVEHPNGACAILSHRLNSRFDYGVVGL